MYTEKQARKKWCPAAKTQRDGFFVNRYIRCIASDCMWWRWVMVQEKLQPDGIKTEFAGLVPGDRGYCGMAGGLR